jgi:hypothetical protein
VASLVKPNPPSSTTAPVEAQPVTKAIASANAGNPKNTLVCFILKTPLRFLRPADKIIM